MLRNTGKYCFLFLSAFLMSIVNQAHALDYQLVNATVEGEDKLVKLYLELNNKTKDVEAMRVEEFQGPRFIEADFYKVRGATNFVLYKQDSRDIVRLKSPNFSNHNGGDVALDFLYNGITGSRSVIKLTLDRDGDEWVLYRRGKRVKKLHMIKNNKILVGTVGIKDILTY